METTIRTAIAAWSAVSPLGFGHDAFSAGLAEGRRTVAPLDPEAWAGPVPEACLVPDFNIKEQLGRKGTRSMDRVTGLAVTTVGRLLKDTEGASGGRPEDPDDGTRTALVLGTNTGSAQSIMDFTRDSLTQSRPYLVDPARFPNTVMNCAAGQSAIWYGLRGPNTTIAAGRVSGLQALQYSVRLQRSGRADTVLCGAAEEFSNARAWLEWHSRPADGPAGPLGEGCAMLLLRPVHPGEQTAGLAEVLGLRFGVFSTEDQVKDTVARVVRSALDEAGVDPADVYILAPSQAPGTLGEQEEAAVAEVLGRTPDMVLRCADLIGDTSAASAAFQCATVLSAAQAHPAASGKVGLVTAVDRDGAVGCALLGLA